MWEVFALTRHGSASLGQLFAKGPGQSTTQLEPNNQEALEWKFRLVLEQTNSVQLYARQVETTSDNRLLVHFKLGVWHSKAALASHTVGSTHSNRPSIYSTLSDEGNADVVVKYIAHTPGSDLEHLAMPGSWDISELQLMAQIYLQEPSIAKNTARKSIPFTTIPAAVVDDTLAAMGWWNWHLKCTNVSALCQMSVTLQFLKTGEVWGNNLLRCDGEPIQPSESGVVQLCPQPRDRYGIRVINDTNVPLYGWAFYLHGNDFSISESFMLYFVLRDFLNNYCW